MRVGVFASLLALAGAALGSATKRWSTDVPSGFVTTNGTTFSLDGKPFAFVGTNAYWLPLLESQADVDSTLASMQAAGVKVLRTWGFNAINGSELANATATNLTYYQLWNSSTWELNEGPQGLQRLDYVIESAAKYDIKIILTFTNNWFGYGGAELYINWIVGAPATHDEFYTNPAIVSEYQRYVSTIVNRYMNSSAIFAWELMNEARCSGDLLPSGPNCKPGSGTLALWYQQQSDYVRSLDPYHMITTGGEGQFYWAQPATYWYNNTLVSDYNYNGEAGEDFESTLGLPNIDFGTYHMYPQTWYPELDFPGSNWTVEQFGLDWIDAHISTAMMVGKPLIIEEFGALGLTNKTSIYPVWVQEALNTYHASIMPWQWGQLNLTEPTHILKYADEILDGATPNDGYAFYPNQTDVWNILLNAAAVQESRSG
ncbi:glycoside hydrolase family 5 protein [Jaapia argillacea MUCL 33604]|uniref:mannan endo-1,4-beta-mannosidase n=1 Tax=Jaapia argillacea MUCL 33604 TaxID=933084 RepID=A0A067QJG6_9AGAM|nr:glycoside hydrolase family 5 protein [Jaapia argillacea MUCL 33604]